MFVYCSLYHSLIYIQIYLSKCCIIVKVLCGVGKRTVPFIITEVSLKEIDIRNWSTFVCLAFFILNIFPHLEV